MSARDECYLQVNSAAGWRLRLGLGIVILLLCGILCAQAPGASQVADRATNVASTVSGSKTASDPEEPSSHLAQGDSDMGFVIGNEDMLAIQVWKEPDVSRTLPVRSDGRISLPLAGELLATGRTPLQLSEDIANKLRVYMTDPRVTVIVQEIHSQKFNILGQIMRPGSYPLTGMTTVVDAIAMAGGFRDFAKEKGIYILRQDASGREWRIPFNYKSAIKGKDPVQNIKLRPHDTVVVP